MAREGGGEIAVSVPRVAPSLPRGHGGVLYRHRDREVVRWLAGSRDSAVEVGDWVGFVPLAGAERWRVAREMTRGSALASAVICPPGVWPTEIGLALAVGDALRVGRGDRRAVVISTDRPVPHPRLVAIPHEVTVTDEDGVEVRVVWEMAASWEVPGWLAGLAARPVVG